LGICQRKHFALITNVWLSLFRLIHARPMSTTKPGFLEKIQSSPLSVTINHPLGCPMVQHLSTGFDRVQHHAQNPWRSRQQSNFKHNVIVSTCPSLSRLISTALLYTPRVASPISHSLDLARLHCSASERLYKDYGNSVQMVERAKRWT
jgi:hypothetical protein